MVHTHDSDPSELEKARVHGHGSELEEIVTGGVNHQSYDNHTSFNKYPTHEPGFENKVCFRLSARPGSLCGGLY